MRRTSKNFAKMPGICRRTKEMFGMTDATVAGGSAFIEASRTQDRVALYLLELMESRRG